MLKKLTEGPTPFLAFAIFAGVCGLIYNLVNPGPEPGSPTFDHGVEEHVRDVVHPVVSRAKQMAGVQRHTAKEMTRQINSNDDLNEKFGYLLRFSLEYKARQGESGRTEWPIKIRAWVLPDEEAATKWDRTLGLESKKQFALVEVYDIWGYVE